MDAAYVITEYNSRRTAFLFEDNKLTKVSFLDSDSLVGNIYTAKVSNIVSSINAAFLDIGEGDMVYYSLVDEHDHIFLNNNRNKVCIGDELLVQVSKDPIKTKKGVVTSDITFKNEYFLINRSGSVGLSKKITDQNRRNELLAISKACIDRYNAEYEQIIPGVKLNAGLIVRTAAESISNEEFESRLIDSLDKLVSIIKKSVNNVCKKKIHEDNDQKLSDICDIQHRKYDSYKIITDLPDVFEYLNKVIEEDHVSLYDDDMISLDKLYDLEKRLKKGFSRNIYLKSGGYIIVEPTEALISIDVNSGKAIQGKNVEKTFLKVNKEAAREIVRILRLRNLSGIILIDFINMKDSSSNNELVVYLKSEMQKDEMKVKYVDITQLGLVELTRKKEYSPLSLADFGIL